MDSVKGWIGPILGIVGSLAGGMMSGPVGAIFGGLGMLGMTIGGILLYNKYKEWKGKIANDITNQNSVTDQASQVVNNQTQTIQDQSTVNAVDAEREKDKNGNPKKP